MRVFVLCFSESDASIWVGEKPLVLASLWSCLTKFVIIIEGDKDGYYVASVPELPGCHTQASTLDELRWESERLLKRVLMWKLLKWETVLSLLVFSSWRFLIGRFDSCLGYLCE